MDAVTTKRLPYQKEHAVKNEGTELTRQIPGFPNDKKEIIKRIKALSEEKVIKLLNFIENLKTNK
jgi:hypothetical protein